MRHKLFAVLLASVVSLARALLRLPQVGAATEAVRGCAAPELRLITAPSSSSRTLTDPLLTLLASILRLRRYLVTTWCCPLRGRLPFSVGATSADVAIDGSAAGLDLGHRPAVQLAR